MSFMNDRFSLYVIDVETTGLGERCDIIEISAYSLSSDLQKTVWLKAINIDAIEPDALRINKHAREDICHLTKVGQERYKDPSVAITEIENFVAEDNVAPENRLLVGQNIQFDHSRLLALWQKNGAEETFPFSKRLMIDTLILQLGIDVANNNFPSQFYNLGSLVERHNVRKLRAHSASQDVLMTKDVFLAQMQEMKKAR